MDKHSLKNELLYGIMKLPPKMRDEFWDELVKIGIIKEEDYGRKCSSEN